MTFKELTDLAIQQNVKSLTFNVREYNSDHSFYTETKIVTDLENLNKCKKYLNYVVVNFELNYRNTYGDDEFKSIRANLWKTYSSREDEEIDTRF